MDLYFVTFLPFCGEIVWWFLWLTESEFAGAALLVFEAAANLQKPIQHLRTLSAARSELRVCLFVHVLEPV